MTTITANEANTIKNAIRYAVISVVVMLHPFITEEELTSPECLATLKETTRGIFTDFCEKEEIYEVEDEADYDDPDDVDETDFSPYVESNCSPYIESNDYEDRYTFDDLGANWY